jgi:hypothetical protein
MGARLQCKDIPAEPILRFIASHDGAWCNWYFGNARDVHAAFPADVPDKLLLAKMAALMRTGLVSGCDCGCRGDYTITMKGRERIGLARERMGLEES